MNSLIKYWIDWGIQTRRMDRKEIRKHFDDFRYLASTEKPHIIQEFVKYEDVVKLVDEIERNNSAK